MCATCASLSDISESLSNMSASFRCSVDLELPLLLLLPVAGKKAMHDDIQDMDEATQVQGDEEWRREA